MSMNIESLVNELEQFFGLEGARNIILAGIVESINCALRQNVISQSASSKHLNSDRVTVLLRIYRDYNK